MVGREGGAEVKGCSGGCEEGKWIKEKSGEKCSLCVNARVVHYLYQMPRVFVRHACETWKHDGVDWLVGFQSTPPE